MQYNEETPSAVSRIPSTMTLPSNATAIRAEITDTFSCDGKIYGYYADVDNDCQIFHICLPVTYADGKENMFRWSFVCPDETIFSQVGRAVFVWLKMQIFDPVTSHRSCLRASGPLIGPATVRIRVNLSRSTGNSDRPARTVQATMISS